MPMKMKIIDDPVRDIKQDPKLTNRLEMWYAKMFGKTVVGFDLAEKTGGASCIAIFKKTRERMYFVEMAHQGEKRFDELFNRFLK